MCVQHTAPAAYAAMHGDDGGSKLKEHAYIEIEMQVLACEDL